MWWVCNHPDQGTYFVRQHQRGKFQSETIDAALRPIAFHFHHAYICWLSHVHSIWLYSQLHSRSSPLHSVGFESSSFNLRAGTKNEFGLAFKPSQMGNERTPTLPPSEINMPRTFKHWSDITAHEKSGAENTSLHGIWVSYIFTLYTSNTCFVHSRWRHITIQVLILQVSISSFVRTLWTNGIGSNTALCSSLVIRARRTSILPRHWTSLC